MWAVPKSSQIIAVSFILLIAAFTFQTPATIASNSEITSTTTNYPSLFVTKVVDKTEVSLGESFLVTITINNFGNKTAYNVTFIDELTAEWVFNVSGLTRISYSQIEPNETRTFSYIVTALSIGDYKLHSANVYYQDSFVNPDEYMAITNAIDITVVEPKEDLSLANYNTSVTLLLVLIFLNIVLFLRIISPKFNRRKEEE